MLPFLFLSVVTAEKKLGVKWQLEVEDSLNIAGAQVSNNTAKFLLIERFRSQNRLLG